MLQEETMAGSYLGQRVGDLSVLPGQLGFETWEQRGGPETRVAVLHRAPSSLPLRTGLLVAKHRIVVVIGGCLSVVAVEENSTSEVIRELPSDDLGGRSRNSAIGCSMHVYLMKEDCVVLLHDDSLSLPASLSVCSPVRYPPTLGGT